MGWEFLAAVAVTASLLIGAHLLEKRSRASRKPDESEVLYLLARLTETSEHEQFRRAASEWNVSDSQMEEDFSRYLLGSDLPAYVRDYLRRAEATHPEVLNPGADFFSGVLLKGKDDGPKG